MRIFLLLCSIIIVIYFTYIFYGQEKKEKALMATNEIVYVQILELSCGKQSHIKFKYQDKEIGKRIFLSGKECSELKTKSVIGLKIDKDENIIFANENYNDWVEAELCSIIVLAIFFIFYIVYYGILPEIKKIKLTY